MMDDTNYKQQQGAALGKALCEAHQGDAFTLLNC